MPGRCRDCCKYSNKHPLACEPHTWHSKFSAVSSTQSLCKWLHHLTWILSPLQLWTDPWLFSPLVFSFLEVLAVSPWWFCSCNVSWLTVRKIAGPLKRGQRQERILQIYVYSLAYNRKMENDAELWPHNIYSSLMPRGLEYFFGWKVTPLPLAELSSIISSA